MTTFKFDVIVTVDETNINAPNMEQLKMAIEESINTTDNVSYGIIDYTVRGEEIENF